MRLLHTSDWHLGQHFMGKTRQAEHQALIDWLLTEVRAQAIDAVLIAGDIFDTGTPPSYARELYSQLVVRLHDAGIALLLLGGNHDSAATLGESRELLACLDATVIAAAGADPAAQIITLPRRDGTPGCIVCAIPFIRPRDVVLSLAGQSAEEKQAALQVAIRDHYQTVFAAAQAKQAAMLAELGHRLPIIATGHLTTVGASESEAVREIYVGAMEAFPTDAFPPADYLALGHIHRQQAVGGRNHIRYSGSPIPLAFDEANHQKAVLIVDLTADGLQAVTPLPVPPFQAMVAIRGNLDSLPAAIGSAAAQGALDRPTWLEVTVVEDDTLPDLTARVDALTRGWPVEVLRLRRERGNVIAGLAAESGETLAELGPHQVFARRLAGESLSPELQQALELRYRALLGELQGSA